MKDTKNICQSGMCRPGGFIITDRAIEFCRFNLQSKLMDIGCGLGATVNHVKEKYKLNIVGLEKDESVITDKDIQSEDIIIGEAENLPFGECELDGLLLECSLSKTEDAVVTLNQCCKVLKPDGYIIISDMYAHGEAKQLRGILGRVDKKETILQNLANCGFVIELFEDYTAEMQNMWMQMIFEYGQQVFCDTGATRDEMKKIKCGYCLIIGKKGRKI